jgi:hypothetical protein
MLYHGRPAHGENIHSTAIRSAKATQRNTSIALTVEFKVFAGFILPAYKITLWK